MGHEQLDHDYRSSMQRAAFSYLQRHEVHYLVDSDLLYDNCVRHMTTALEVPVFMAQQLVHIAWTELQLINQRKCLGYPALALLPPHKLLNQLDTVHKQPPQ